MDSYSELLYGFITYNKESKKNKEEIAIVEQKQEEEYTQTVQTEVKTSPNAIITKEIYYKDCGHSKIESEQIKSELVNLTKDEFSKYYSEWKIEIFSEEAIYLYKEEKFCNEHYIVKDVDGYVGIYNLDKDDNIININKITDIETSYLTEIDIEKLKIGIKVYCKRDLNKILEDFE